MPRRRRASCRSCTCTRSTRLCTRSDRARQPWGARDATWSMVIAAIDPDPAKATALKNWARTYWEGVHPHNLGGGYVNFMSDDEGEARVKASYGANFERLVAVKRSMIRKTCSA